MLPAEQFWRGKRVLLTGHTGFKGAWLALWLQRLGAQVTGLALAPATTPNLFTLAGVAARLQHHVCDVRDAPGVEALVQRCRPQVVLHLAAQALVRPSYEQPLETFATNVMGTANLLDALRRAQDLRSVVVVTTDKVYQSRQPPHAFGEDNALGGTDPYSASKAAAEMVVASYRSAYFLGSGVGVASARAGNVIGGGDWSQDRLLPDAARAWGSGRALTVRRPAATRPWQHVLEPLGGYLRLAQRLWDDSSAAGAFNFGPDALDAASVRDVVELARAAYGGAEVIYSDGETGPHEAAWLALDNRKAREVLGIVPRWTLAESVQRSMLWYRRLHQGADAASMCQAELSDYGVAA